MRYLIALIALAACSTSTAFAQTASSAGDSEPTVTVVGNGLSERAPDLARLSIDIVTNDESATRSVSTNNDRYRALLTKLAPLGLAPDALKTTGFNLSYIPHPPKAAPPDQRQGPYGYVTTRSMQLTMSIGSVGKAIDGATAAGVTNVGGVSFDLKDRIAPFREALSAAVADARADAQAVAAASGLSLGRIVKMSAGGTTPPRTYAPQFAGALTPSTPTSIEPGGPIQIAAQVTITYALR